MKNKLLAALILLMPLQASALCLGCSCSASATGVSFGAYYPLSGSNVDAAGNVRVSCQAVLNIFGTINYSVALSTGHSGTYTPRHMDNAGNPLNYNLYTDDTYTTIWGNGTGSSGVVAGAIALSLLLPSAHVDHPIYGRIPGSQTSAVVGNYSDTITVTVTYN
jgi:spore coat protein U-like protein